MSRTIETIRKLKGRGLGELRERGAQKAAALAERRGWSALARLPGDAEFFRLLDGEGETLDASALLAEFRARNAPHFFASFKDLEATTAEFRRRWPEEESQLIARADAAAEGRLDLLGHRGLDFGRPVDWLLNPVSGRREPLAHWSTIEEVAPGAAGDKKLVWELNRHQHFVTLGRAYRATGDERYAEAFVEQLTAWAEANPPKLGPNWLSSLELAFRSISWLWALELFRDSPRLTPEFYLLALKLLYLHARHVETYLSTYSSPNTHLTGEALGLYYLGLLLPRFARAPRWRETGERILLAELDRHVRPDGVYFEQSSYYHRYTADFCTHLYALAAANGGGGFDKLRRALNALLEHLMHVTKPDGTTPLFGDDDGGKLLKFDERPAADFRPALSNGAALLGRGDYKFVAGAAAPETLWLLGPEGLLAFDELEAAPPAETSRAFRDGGYYVMRDGWRRNSDYMFLDCGPHGTLNCGHAHADVLSFELAAGGRTLLVDPGTYTYTASAELRDYFRSSAAHNTLTVDGESSSVPAGPFSWRHVAQARAVAWHTHRRFDLFAGTHDGYARLSDPVRHERRVLFVKHSYWVVCDRAEAAGAHCYDLNFHFAPDTAPSLVSDEDGVEFVREENEGGAGLDVRVFGVGGRWRREEGWVSSCYAERRPAPVFVHTAEGTGPQEFVTLLVPRGPGVEVSRVRAIGSAGVRAFEITRRGGRDLLIFNGGVLDGPVAVDTDFDLALVRLAADSDEAEELILIDGRRLSVEGHSLFSSEARAARVYARREAGTWRVEAVGEAPDELNTVRTKHHVWD
ncbi:MAG: alginate lyase family protein [Acidobacteria bacterium]|nr:alginate lyase family protein [Acidobacteriota bacterium]